MGAKRKRHEMTGGWNTLEKFFEKTVGKRSIKKIETTLQSTSLLNTSKRKLFKDECLDSEEKHQTIKALDERERRKIKNYNATIKQPVTNQFKKSENQYGSIVESEKKSWRNNRDAGQVKLTKPGLMAKSVSKPVGAALFANAWQAKRK